MLLWCNKQPALNVSITVPFLLLLYQQTEALFALFDASVYCVQTEEIKFLVNSLKKFSFLESTLAIQIRIKLFCLI